MNCDMKYKLITLLLAVCLFSCVKEDDIVKESDRTILVYMAAENSLSQFALDDVEEMITGMKEIDDSRNNLLVYLDAVLYDSDNKTKLSPAIYRFRKNKNNEVVKEMVYQYPEQDASSITVERMSDVFKRTYTAYQAKSYGLVLWSHGEGWIPYLTSSLRSFGQDGGSTGLMMDILDLEEAIRQGTTYLAGQSRFDFIYFDACYMQSVEVAYQLRSYANYIIGCPMETPASGSPFDKILPYLFTEGEAGVKGFASYYYDSYAKSYNGGVNSSNFHWTSGVSISVVRTDALEQLAQATRQIYASYGERMQTITEADVASVQYFDHNRRYNRVQMRIYSDLGDYARYLSTDSEYSRWKEAMDAAVVFAQATPTCYCSSADIYGGKGDIAIQAFSGLSSYILFEKDDKYANWNTYYRKLDWYKQAYP